jgi:K319L-like, PKD domain
MGASLRATPLTTRPGRALAALALLLVAACGTGSGKNSGGNHAPVANAGADQDVLELSVVQLAGTGTDSDRDTLTYSWVQTAGTTVTLTNADMAGASFTAPDVAAGAPETLTFRLTVGDGMASASDTVNITVSEPSPVVTLTGTVRYEFPQHPVDSCAGLDFDNPTPRPIRGATVQLIDAGTNAILGSTVADDSGGYSFANIDANTMVRLRVRAELKKTTGTSRWNVEMRDNYDNGASPPALQNRPLYVVQSPNFDIGSSSTKTRDLTATTGWDTASGSYTGDRSAAPFAILDAIYTEVRFIEAADPAANFPALDAFWSIHNTASTSGNIDHGELGASFYTGDPEGDGTANPSLFLVGDAADDPDEFDDHVVGHEWGHYFEDNFSRSDSIGGTHFIGDALDPRVAFGEGWATAFAAMALGDPLYCDTTVPGTSGGFGIGAETGAYNPQGWYDEIAVVRFLYDLFDDNNDPADNGDTVSLGFGPIFAALTGPQRTTEAFTTLFTFATELRAALTSSADQQFVDDRLAQAYTTAAGLDIWGTNEQNDAGGQDVFPLYTDYVAGDPPLNICVNSQFDGTARDGNKLAESRFLRIAVPMTGQYDVTVQATTTLPVTPDASDRDQSDPDIHIFHAGQLVAAGTSGDDNLESFRTQNSLVAGATYVADLEDWRFDDVDAAPASYPQEVCFDVSFVAAP